MTRTVLVTGANRGIGFETAKGFAAHGCKVLMGVRDESDGEAARKDITGNDIHVVEIDLTNADTITECIVRAEAVYGNIDILINNAGVMVESSFEELEAADFEKSLKVHVEGPLQLCQLLLPGMLERNFGRIVNVSSGWGAFTEGMEGPPAYAISKAALNALTMNLSNIIEANQNVKINAMCPGWVHTRMGGKDAPRSPEKGAETALWLGMLDEDGPTGGFFRDKKKINW
ncbi:SDR family NAD(P)-dependent oxidoreductase [Alteromonas sp. ASW11-130]|uniref:SDR family NAD(P)-dependent oxidoreductase n=1 Tax=Alteromonas sp. ASW11-130 TaxID=3015775 RepID=UPI002242971F|nr:SDR family NAD(P)-dependent oxidoreductase [Alteromonas sp. ASW11-130]MCW8092139.1 SDR family NAD(P)-dependent oxidoreductase [Alteromonas sp. ASW11-130]